MAFFGTGLAQKCISKEYGLQFYEIPTFVDTSNYVFYVAAIELALPLV